MNVPAMRCELRDQKVVGAAAQASSGRDVATLDREQLRPVLRIAVVSAFERRIDVLVAEAEAALTRDIPSAPDDADFRRAMREVTRAVCDDFMALAQTGAVAASAVRALCSVAAEYGVSPSAVFRWLRIGQHLIWRSWMDATFAEASSSDEVAGAMRLGYASLEEYFGQVLDETLAAFDRHFAMGGGHGTFVPVAVVRQLLAGDPADAPLLAQHLRYHLDQEHVALSLWCEADGCSSLGPTVAKLSGLPGVGDSLAVPIGTHRYWLWLAGDRKVLDLCRRIDLPIGIRLAAGRPGAGAEGFRASHEQAVSVSRLMESRADAPAVATYDELAAVLLASSDRESAWAFAARVLGPLIAGNDTAARLRETLRVFLEEAENAPATAARLHIHRNTVLQRVDRALRMLDCSLSGQRMDVLLALELVRWLPAPDAQTADGDRG